MLLSTGVTLRDLNAISRSRPTPLGPRLSHMLAALRQRQIDRAVARTVLLLNHPGIADDYRAARRR